VGHFHKNLGGVADSSFKLDVRSTLLEVLEEVNNLRASVDTLGVLGIKSGPSSILFISGGLSFFNSVVNTIDLIKSFVKSLLSGV